MNKPQDTQLHDKYLRIHENLATRYEVPVYFIVVIRTLYGNYKTRGAVIVELSKHIERKHRKEIIKFILELTNEQFQDINKPHTEFNV